MIAYHNVYFQYGSDIQRGKSQMTIDKTIDFFNSLECHTPQAKDAKDVAVDTMRKFKKIQEIVNSNVFHPVSDNTIDGEHEGYVRYMKIYELLKICEGFDGKFD